MRIIKKEGRTKIASKFRSNVYGSLKLLNLTRRKWYGIRKNLRIRVQSNRAQSFRLIPEQRNIKRSYKHLLRKKQLFKLYYNNLKEAQLKKLFKDPIYKKQYNVNQINYILNKLESRLDVVLLRMGFVSSIFQAKQLIIHKKILVNGKITSYLGFHINENDIISIHPQYKKQVFNQLAYKLHFTNLFYLDTYVNMYETYIAKQRQKNFLKENLFIFNKFIRPNEKFFKMILKKRIIRRKKNKKLFLRRVRRRRQEYYFIIKKYKFFKYKNRLFLNYLNENNYSFKKKETDYFSFLNKIRTPSHILVNYNILIGIFLYSPNLENIPYYTNMDLKTVQKYYNKMI